MPQQIILARVDERLHVTALRHERLGLDLHIGRISHTVSSLMPVQSRLTVRHVDLEDLIAGVCVEEVLAILRMHRLLR